MDHETSVFTSTRSPSVKGPRFENQDEIQKALRQICRKWWRGLNKYTMETKELFGHAERPWDHNERVIVSSLSSAITRSFPSSLTIEELPEDKDGTKSGNGRVDLWASIPNLPRAGQEFSFHLEAKKAQNPHTLRKLHSFLCSDYGMPKMLRDFRKSNSKRFDQRSAYGKLSKRKHAHYVIGMLVAQLEREKADPSGKKYFDGVKKVLRGVVEEYMSTRSVGVNGSKIKTPKRKLNRFPTVALIVEPQDGQPGMIAIFTVLARSGFPATSAPSGSGQ